MSTLSYPLEETGTWKDGKMSILFSCTRNLESPQFAPVLPQDRLRRAMTMRAAAVASLSKVVPMHPLGVAKARDRGRICNGCGSTGEKGPLCRRRSPLPWPKEGDRSIPSRDFCNFRWARPWAFCKANPQESVTNATKTPCPRWLRLLASAGFVVRLQWLAALQQTPIGSGSYPTETLHER